MEKEAPDGRAFNEKPAGLSRRVVFDNLVIPEDRMLRIVMGK
jgi:hypothetical protein